MITRREFLAATSALAILAALDIRLATAHAQGTAAELMVPPVLGEMWLGKEDAAVTVIEYASLWCSHCAAFHKEVYPELKKRYIDTGKIRFIFREFPINERGALGSMLARCTGRNGKERFFAMVDVLFENQDKWAFVRDPGPPLLTIARQAGFNEETFNACVRDQKLLDGLSAEQSRASSKLGVELTPTVFVNGRKVRANIDEIAKVIDPLLKN